MICDVETRWGGKRRGGEVVVVCLCVCVCVRSSSRVQVLLDSGSRRVQEGIKSNAGVNAIAVVMVTVTLDGQ